MAVSRYMNIYIYMCIIPARVAELLTDPLGPGACRQPLTEPSVYDMTLLNFGTVMFMDFFCVIVARQANVCATNR